MIVFKIVLAALLGGVLLADLLVLSAASAQNMTLLVIALGLLRWPFGLAIYALPLAVVADVIRAVARGWDPKRHLGAFH